jgi:hypothetical protein
MDVNCLPAAPPGAVRVWQARHEGRQIDRRARRHQHLHTAEAQRSCLLFLASPDVPRREETDVPNDPLA